MPPNPVTTLSNADKADAVLRDPNAPGDVRAFVAQLTSVNNYLSGVDFDKDDDGYVSVVPRTETEPEPAP